MKSPKTDLKPHSDARLTAVTGGAGTPLEPAWTYPDACDVAVAHAAWGLIVRDLGEAETLSAANGATVERLVRFHVEFQRASRDVEQRGTLVAAKRTGVPAVNPYWPVMRQASAAIRSLEVTLGLPPLHRGRTSKVTKNERKTPRAADAYLRPVPRS